MKIAHKGLHFSALATSLIIFSGGSNAEVTYSGSRAAGFFECTAKGIDSALNGCMTKSLKHKFQNRPLVCASSYYTWNGTQYALPQTVSWVNPENVEITLKTPSLVVSAGLTIPYCVRIPNPRGAYKAVVKAHNPFASRRIDFEPHWVATVKISYN